MQRLIALVGDADSSDFQLVPESPRPEPRLSGLGARPSLVYSPSPSGSLRFRSSAAASASAAPTDLPLGFSPDPRPLGSSVPADSSAPAAARSTRGISPRSRGAACREIGLFLKRARDGEHRGVSGRDRLPDASRYWVVVRDFSGNLLEPVGIFSRFGDCKGLVKRGSDLGNSVFIGLPSRGDVIAVLDAAGIPLPDRW